MARKSKNKPTKFRIAIVGEGITEWYYFINMRHAERFSFKVEPELPNHSDYKSVISTARRKRNEGYDLVFCVLDLDRILANPTEKKGYYSEKAKKKLNAGIEFIETMPCIELWFLLHFLNNYSAKIYLNYEQLSKALKKHIPCYGKTADFFQKNPIYEYLSSKGSYENADKFAQRLASDKLKSDNPYFNFTDINKLIKQLKAR
jgi:hypothetical protein